MYVIIMALVAYIILIHIWLVHDPYLQMTQKNLCLS